MRKYLRNFLFFLAALTVALPAYGQAAREAYYSRVGGGFVAVNYSGWHGVTQTANTGTGSQTYLVQISGALADGNPIPPLFVNQYLTWDIGASQETVQVSSVSSTTCPGGGGGGGANVNCYNVTSTFANAHGTSTTVTSGSAGLDEAQYAAFLSGGGSVVIDSAWSAIGGSNLNITQLTVYPSVMIADYRAAAPQFWTPVGGATAISAPAVLTTGTVTNSTTPAGSYTSTNAYVLCVAYVDVMGQEGQCSPTFSETPTAATGNSFTITAPIASTGAVGFTPYISLTNGTYQLAYKVPLVTQPTVLGAAPVANGVCTLTVIETITPACAVANTNYSQVGSNAVVTALTLNTSPIDPQVTIVSTTSVYVPNAGGRTAYTYAPGSRMGINGTVGESLPFTISAADTTTTPSVIGTINVQPNFVNFPGKIIEVCGKATTTASAATIISIQFQWDAVGQNTAGKGVQIGNLSITPATAFATTLVGTFCEDFVTTVASASATGGTIQPAGGYLNTSGVASAAAGQGAGSDATIAAVASLNLAADARLNVIYVHTTATDGTAVTLQNLTVKVLN
jgi:hypothetical protein